MLSNLVPEIRKEDMAKDPALPEVEHAWVGWLVESILMAPSPFRDICAKTKSKQKVRVKIANRMIKTT